MGNKSAPDSVFHAENICNSFLVVTSLWNPGRKSSDFHHPPCLVCRVPGSKTCPRRKAKAGHEQERTNRRNNRTLD